MPEGRPTTLTNVDIQAIIDTSAVRSKVEKRVAIEGIALRKETQIMLTTSLHLDPHGKTKRGILVDGEGLARFMHTPKQSLLIASKGKGTVVAT